MSKIQGFGCRNDFTYDFKPIFVFTISTLHGVGQVFFSSVMNMENKLALPTNA